MTPSVFTIYSDDIRQEVGNKTTFVGMYQGSMYAREFPITLARLCVSVFYTHAREELPSKITIDVSLAGEELANSSFVPEEIPSSIGLDEEHPGIIQANFIFSPLEVTEPGVIRVRVTVDDHVLDGFPLNILKGNPSQLVSG